MAESLDSDDITSLRLNPIREIEAEAAVAVILKPSPEGFEVLLVRRALNPLDPWSGDIAFPGGRRRRGESLMETALREAREEIGVDLRRCRVLGTLDVSFSLRAPGLRVLPFVYLCEGKLRVKLGEELSDYFWVPLKELEASTGYATIAGVSTPAFLLREGVVWGLTYRMLRDLLERVSP